MEDNVIRMPSTHQNPTPQDEQELADPRFLERQLAGIDPLQSTLPDFDAVPEDPMTEFYARRPASEYVDLTFSSSFGFPEPSRRFRRYSDLSESAPIPRGRARIGRGGRVIFDRPFRDYYEEIPEATKSPYFDDMSDTEEEQDLNLDSDSSKSVLSVPLPFYTLQELSLLNGLSRRPPAPALRRLEGPPTTPSHPPPFNPSMGSPNFSPPFRPPPPRPMMQAQ